MRTKQTCNILPIRTIQGATKCSKNKICGKTTCDKKIISRE